jgi:DNA helicase-2/ATP-dependent DNA helicase PcrA
MLLTDFHTYLDTIRGYPLDSEQRLAVDHPSDPNDPERPDGPLWLIAGPGSGKSEVLVGRTLKLLCVDAIPPQSILLTTFTKKAGRNLEDRLASYLAALQEADPTLSEVDLSEVRVGTLHSLCNDILQEYRYAPYQNVRLLDDVEQSLFTYQRADISRRDDLEFWRFFHYAVPAWGAGARFVPSRWKRTSAAVTLFNHIVDDCVDLDRMRAAGPHWEALSDFYLQYSDALQRYHRCDFAHLQKHFREFLESPAGERLLDGDENHPPLQHILVDEYQDTNPIQERIYLALANRPPHNLTVVGDDDQALYRFRGGTVACMVHFGQACDQVLDVGARPIQLLNNYRSHRGVVDFFNDYVTSFPEMREPGVRAPNKQPVNPASRIDGDHPSVSWIQSERAGDLGDALAGFVQDHLVADGIVTDLNQCVLLLPSPKDAARSAGPYLRAFEQLGIPVYNPRSQTFMECEEVQCLLAALVDVIDPRQTFQGNRTRDLADTVNSWFDCFEQVRQRGEFDLGPLVEYVIESEPAIARLCRDNPGSSLGVSLLEIVYRILAHDPFRTWRQDPAMNLRLAKVTRLLEGYNSMSLDRLWANEEGTDLADGFRDRFFYMMVGYLMDARIGDHEDEEVIVPPGRLPIMSIHQAKGLEFPFVFVANLSRSPKEGAAQILDQELRPFRNDICERPEQNPSQLAIEDDIRLWYVAYSRAEYGLLLVAAFNQLRGKVSVPGRDHLAFRRDTPIVFP